MQLTLLDWTVFFGYFALLALAGWWVNQRKAGNSNDYFLAANSMPVWVVAVSVLATSQSAATFLGGPDMGFRGNLSYLASNIGALIATFIVIKFLLPRYYQLKVTTVYELLEQRFGASAKDHAGKMYLFGRVFASGARLYMAAIAVAMLLFNNIQASSVVAAIVLLALVGLAAFSSGSHFSNLSAAFLTALNPIEDGEVTLRRSFATSSTPVSLAACSIAREKSRAIDRAFAVNRPKVEALLRMWHLGFHTIKPPLI